MKPGDLVLVRWGSGGGSQVARVIAPEFGGSVMARRWKARGGGWTSARTIPLHGLMGAPAATDPRLQQIAEWEERLFSLVGSDVVGGGLPDPQEEGEDR